MGRETRFRSLFEETYPAVARYARNRGYQDADADDLVAATFEVAWRRLERVPAGGDALPWLLAVARNLSRNAHRRVVREGALVDRLAAAERQPATTSQVGGFGDQPAGWDQVRGALGALKPIDRELVLLVAWDELEPGQAGRVLGLRPVAARSRLHRARRRLMQLLDQEPTAIAATAASIESAVSGEGSP